MNTNPLTRPSTAGPHSDDIVSYRYGDLLELLGEFALPPWPLPHAEAGDAHDLVWVGGDVDCAPVAEMIVRRLHEIEQAPEFVGERVMPARTVRGRVLDWLERMWP